MNKNGGVFFDCWDTILKFNTIDKKWRILPLVKHCTNTESIDFEEVYNFSEKYLMDFYFSKSNYELTIEGMLNLICTYFGIKLNCTTSQCGDEIMDYLNPTPMDGIYDVFKFLNKNKIKYAVLSNTIYTTSKTNEIIEKYLPHSGIMFYLGSAEISVKKPNALFFQAGLNKAKLEIKESIYIGDNYNADVIGSSNAGFKKSIWLNWRKEELPPSAIDITKNKNVIVVNGYNDLLKNIEEILN